MRNRFHCNNTEALLRAQVARLSHDLEYAREGLREATAALTDTQRALGVTFEKLEELFYFNEEVRSALDDPQGTASSGNNREGDAAYG